MSHHSANLCNACHEREATCHITEVADGVAHTRGLCSDCFAGLDIHEAQHIAAAAEGAKCQYCGAPANIGGSDPFAVICGAQRIKYRCFACSSELSRYAHDALRGMQNQLSRDSQLEEIRKLSVAVERHMQQWAAQRTRRADS